MPALTRTTTPQKMSKDNTHANKRRKKEDKNTYVAFLIPRFANAASEHVQLNEDGLSLGRNDGVLGIVDKNVSRSQASVRLAVDPTAVTVRALGVNPLHIVKKNGAKIELKRGEEFDLFDGDCVWLLPDKYEIKIEIERVLTEAERRGDVDDDDSATQPLGDETSTDDDDERDTTVDRDKTVIDPSQFDDLDGDAQFNYENAFQFVSQERYRRALRKQPWNTAAWLRWFEHHAALDAYNEAAVRAMRVLVLEGVIDCLQRGWYQPPGGAARVSFDRARARDGILRSELFASFQFTEKLATRRFSEPAKIVVREVDCIEGALHLKLDKGCNVCVLNMANATRPGGGYKTGAGAQEENLHRRSNLYQHLDDPNKEFPEKTWSYPIPEFGAVYSPDVAFFRASEMDGYEFMPNIEYLSVISVAADFKPKLIERELPLVTADNDSKYGVQVELQLMPEFELRMKKRILHMLGLCVARDHDAVVLSAFGCGAFRNPPRHVAQLFRSVIKEYGFHHQFKYIMFAIIDDHNARQAHNPDGNFAPFYEVFYKKPPPN